jgi:hypothetical protein
MELPGIETFRINSFSLVSSNIIIVKQETSTYLYSQHPLVHICIICHRMEDVKKRLHYLKYKFRGAQQQVYTVHMYMPHSRATSS